MCPFALHGLRGHLRCVGMDTDGIAEAAFPVSLVPLPCKQGR